jgi:hypothetical protein
MKSNKILDKYLMNFNVKKEKKYFINDLIKNMFINKMEKYRQLTINTFPTNFYVIKVSLEFPCCYF